MAKGYQRKDFFYRTAKQQGYRSRAAYKLLELDAKYQIFQRADTVLDLGCWPGGWLQVAAERVADVGLVVGIDLKPLDPLAAKNVKFICGDACDDCVLQEALGYSQGGFNIVISDMSPKLSGVKAADVAAVVGCAELAYFVATRALRPQGSMVLKLFKGGDIENFYRSLRGSFKELTRTELKSSRSGSSEFYCVAKGFNG